MTGSAGCPPIAAPRRSPSGGARSRRGSSPSTVLLSAIVVGVVGWLPACSRPATACSSNRVDAVVAEAERRDRRAPATSSSRARAPTIDAVPPAARRWSSRSSSAARPRLRASCSPGRSATGGRLADGGAKFTQGLDARERARRRCEAALRRPSPAPPGPTPTSRPRADVAGPARAEPGIVVGTQVRLPADSSTYTLYYLFPLDEEQETLAPGRPRAADRRRAAAAAGRRADLAGHPPGGHPGPDGPPGRRAAGRRPAAGAPARARRGRPRPARHVVQPDGHQPADARSASSRSCAGCSAGSSPTCPTSCARR